MTVSSLSMFQQTPAGPAPSTVVQTIWIALAALAIISIVVVGFTAKKIENIHNPTYSKAFLAQMLVGFLATAGFFIFGLFLQAPAIVAFGIAFSIIPIIVYRLVFASQWSEAATIWLVVTLVQAGVTYGLVLAGMVSLAAITGA